MFNTVGCEPGSYFNLDLHECQTCPRGTYNDGFSDEGCTMCPQGTTTAQLGARAPDECEGNLLFICGFFLK